MFLPPTCCNLLNASHANPTSGCVSPCIEQPHVGLVLRCHDIPHYNCTKEAPLHAGPTAVRPQRQESDTLYKCCASFTGLTDHATVVCLLRLTVHPSPTSCFSSPTAEVSWQRPRRCCPRPAAPAPPPRAQSPYPVTCTGPSREAVLSVRFESRRRLVMGE